MIYLIIAMFLTGAALGGYGVGWVKDSELARHEKAQAEAQAKIDAQQQQIEQGAENHAADVEAAYNKGEVAAHAKALATIAKGQNYVAANAVFRNPDCVVPADGMLILASARSTVSTAPDTGGTNGAVSGAGADTGRTNAVAVPSPPPGRGTVAGVPQSPRPAGGNGQVSGTGTTVHPKPRPIQ